MVTIIEVPGPVTGVRSGSERIRYVIHKAPENEVSLYLNGAEAPTNLIIRSNKKKFIFDIIPNHKIHQDALEVLGDYGAPALDGELGIKLIESSDAKERSQ
jgi:heme-binding NEAT domain protein